MTTGELTLKQALLDKLFLTSPGEDLVPKLIYQMAQVKAFTKLFGTYKVDENLQKNSDQMRWADYDRGDWSLRQLPAISVFESGAEQKESDNAYLTGSVTITVFWPASMRRSDAPRVAATFKGILENFFASKWASNLLDPHVSVVRPEKVFGLNQIGKEMSWTTNAFGSVETQEVPATMVEVRYRIDLRRWYYALEQMGRTKDDPFDVTLQDLRAIDASIQGLDDSGEVIVEIETQMDVNSGE